MSREHIQRFLSYDASRQLIIGARKGAYKGMLNNRKFTIVLQDGTRKVVDYKGKRVSVKF